MGCGCKKNKNTEPVAQPAEIKVTVDETTQQTTTLTEEQQKTVDLIITKLNQINS
jgi:hypothetical protein